MDLVLSPLVWVVTGLISGSLMFSFWIGRIALGKDIREYGDGNPGATNLIRAGGPLWGTLGIVLDFLKGGIPIGLANFIGGLAGLPLFVVSVSPIFGHAFSPFLGFRGGKSVAVTFGVWSGLTLWEIPTLLGAALALWFALVKNEGWAVSLALVSILVYLLTFSSDLTLIAVWMVNFAIIVWMHRIDLRKRPVLRHWIRKLVHVRTKTHEYGITK